MRFLFVVVVNLIIFDKLITTKAYIAHPHHYTISPRDYVKIRLLIRAAYPIIGKARLKKEAFCKYWLKEYSRLYILQNVKPIFATQSIRQGTYAENSYIAHYFGLYIPQHNDDNLPQFGI